MSDCKALVIQENSLNKLTRAENAAIYSTVVIESPNGLGLASLVRIKFGSESIDTIVIPNTLVSADTIKNSINQIKLSFHHMNLTSLYEEYFREYDNNFENKIWQICANQFIYTIIVLNKEDADHYLNVGAKFIQIGNSNINEDIILVEFLQNLSYQNGKINYVTPNTFSVDIRIRAGQTIHSAVLLSSQGEFLGMHGNSYPKSGSAKRVMENSEFELLIKNYMKDLNGIK